MYLTQAIHRAASATPHAAASVCDARTLSWLEMKQRIEALAGGMRELGIGAGDRVAVLALNSDRYIELYFAVLWAGAVIVPMNTRWSVAEHVYSLRDSGAALLFVDDTFLEIGRAIRDECEHVRNVVHMGDKAPPSGMLAYEAIVAEAPAAADAFRSDSDLAGIFYTGGTTGTPKGVMLSHGGLWSSAVSVGAALHLTNAVRYLHAAPMFHLADGGMTFATSIFGGTHVLMPSFEPAAFLDIVERYRVTDALLVPTMIRLLLDCPDLGRRDVSSLRRLVYGASPMAESMLREAMTRLPNVAFTQAYGQTELSPLCSVLSSEYHVLEGPNAGKLRSAGRAGVCVEAKIADDNGQERPRNTVGEVWVRGPNVMLGYWNKPAETAAALVDGWVRTGDGGYMDEDGFIYIVDRIKDMIVSGGENVFSAEVENALMQHAAVSECAVIGVPDERWGERVHAVVVLKPGVTLTADVLVEHCRALIARYKCPRSIDFSAAPLPKSGAGKILKTDLRRPYWEGRERSVS